MLLSVAGYGTGGRLLLNVCTLVVDAGCAVCDCRAVHQLVLNVAPAESLVKTNLDKCLH
jgi:hypothetical protein